MSALPSIPGVVRREVRRPAPSVAVTALALNEDFTESSSADLIAAIDDGLRLTFFDAEHPQRSDPGLYVSLQRHDGQLFVKGANHGWSYPWLPIDGRRAAKWLWLCRDENNDDGRHESSTMRLMPGFTITPDSGIGAGQPFFDWLTTRLAS